jgi:hypothetical protein
MNLILPKHKENLTQLIGGIIEYGALVGKAFERSVDVFITGQVLYVDA